MLLFITRKYPPSVGGMEALSYYMTTTVSRHISVHIIKWGGAQKWVPFFVIYAFIQALFVLLSKPITLIHIGDPVLAPLGMLLRFLSRCPVIVNVHGLDVIYPNWLYQAIIPACLRKLDHVIAISEYTRQACIARGIPTERITIIPVGVDVKAFNMSLPPEEEAYCLEQWSLSPRPEHIMLTVGRLVPRKGVEFFVSQVLPLLRKRRDDWVYIVVGDGPDRGRIEAAIQENDLDDNVRILGLISEQARQAAYAIADIFIMPNVPVSGDAEGFGIVILEARASGLPIVASNLQGIRDSFTAADGGQLVPPKDVEAFVKAVDRLLDVDESLEDRIARRQRVAACYDWSEIAKEYMAVFREVQSTVKRSTRS